MKTYANLHYSSLAWLCIHSTRWITKLLMINKMHKIHPIVLNSKNAHHRNSFRIIYNLSQYSYTSNKRRHTDLEDLLLEENLGPVDSNSNVSRLTPTVEKQTRKEPEWLSSRKLGNRHIHQHLQNRGTKIAAREKKIIDS